jgi:hypothetical protein
MKKSVLIFFTISSIISCTETPCSKQIKTSQSTDKKNEIITDLNNTKTLLKYLYGSDKFDSLKTILWMPDEIDHPQIPISYDSIAHTGIDTVLYFKNSDGIESAAVILANYKFVLDEQKVVVGGSHFEGISLGVALFSKYKNQWKLDAFKKHLTNLGYYGTYRTGRKDQGKIALKKIGDHWTCLSFTQGIGGNTGVFWGTETWYSIEQDSPKFEQMEEPDEINIREYVPLNQLFTYNYSHNYYFPDLEHQNVIDIKINTVKTNFPIYDLKLNIEKYNYAVESNKTNSLIKQVKYFRYSPELHLFLEKK